MAQSFVSQPCYRASVHVMEYIGHTKVHHIMLATLEAPREWQEPS